MSNPELATGGPCGAASPSRLPRGSAESRLLDAVTDVAARDGYTHLTVERILAVAGVSRATFYQYFANVDDCFWSAHRVHAERVVAEVQAIATRSKDPVDAVLTSLLAAAGAAPGLARVLMTEGLAAGRPGQAERELLLARIEQAMAGPSDRATFIDLPLPILLGGAFTFLSMPVDGDDSPGRRSEQVLEWTRVFERPVSCPSLIARLAPALTPRPFAPPSPPRRMRFPGQARERILRATALMTRDRGYRGMTVDDIAATAGVSRRQFYNEFAGKSDAFVAAFEYGFQQTLAACTPAFFGASAWPERIWQSVEAFTGYFAREPAFAHLGFVDCYAIGPRFASRVHDAQLAFTLFLEEGYRQRPERGEPPRATSPLTAAAIAEAGLQVTSRSPSLFMRRMQPLAVYIALAPFIGVEESGAFVLGKLAAGRTEPSAAA